MSSEQEPQENGTSNGEVPEIELIIKVTCWIPIEMKLDAQLQ